MPRFRASSLGMRFSWIQEFGISTFTGRTPNGLWPVVSASTSIVYGMISPAIPPSPMRPPAQPGGMRAGFAQFTAFSQDAKDNKIFEQVKLTMPVLAVGGEKSFGP